MSHSVFKVGDEVVLSNNWQTLFDHTSMGSSNCKRFAGFTGIVMNVDEDGDLEIMIDNYGEQYVLTASQHVVKHNDPLQHIQKESQVF